MLVSYKLNIFKIRFYLKKANGTYAYSEIFVKGKLNAKLSPT